MHDTNNDLPIYRDVTGDGDELHRAMKHASAGLRPPGALAFHADEQEWSAFYSGSFATLVAPHVTSIYGAAGAGETNRVIALDQSFAGQLDATAARRLAGSAGVVFEARAGAGAMRLLDRLCERQPACTFTTAFAAHAASFNVPLLHALVAYLAIEWRSGHEPAGRGLENSREWEKVFTQQLLAAPEPIRQILARSMRGWADVA